MVKTDGAADGSFRYEDALKDSDSDFKMIEWCSTACKLTPTHSNVSLPQKIFNEEQIIPCKWFVTARRLPPQEILRRLS